MKKSHKTSICAQILIAKINGSEFNTASEKTVLLSIAGYASAKNNYSAWPSRRTIAENTRLSRATVTRAITALVKAGWITRQYQFRDNMQTSSLYTLCMDKINTLLASIGRGLTAISRGAHHATQKVYKEVLNTYYAPRNDGKSHLSKHKPRSTRDMSLEECLLDTSWAI